MTRHTKKGFTMIELTLSMAFIGVLLVTISMITFSIITIYQKGLSIRAVNSTGRELVDEFSRAISSAPAMSASNLCSAAGLTGSNYNNCVSSSNTNGDAYLLTFQQYYGNTFTMPTNGATVADPPIFGAFCTGRVSYVWNTGYAINGYGNNQPIDLHYYTTDQPTVAKSFKDKTGQYPRLVKVTDPSRSVCAKMLNGSYSPTSRRDYYEVSTPLSAGEVPDELLDSSEDNLTIYDLRIFRRTQHTVTSHSFYAGTFLLATLRGEINITGQGDYCTDEPDDLTTDFAYCALNKFNFAMRATGELNNEEKKQNQ